MKHSTPIGIMFKRHGINCQVVKSTVNLDDVYRKDVDEARKPYYQLRAIFKCESCGVDTERQILYIYNKVHKGRVPYVLCDSCLHQHFSHTSKQVAIQRWEDRGFVYLKDKLDDLDEYWNHEKNSMNFEEILLKDVTGKEGRYRYTSVNLYCYLCEAECERTLRTVLNNKSKTGHSWVLCDDCKSRSRTSKGEILCLLISEYCSQRFGLSYQFQYGLENLVSKKGDPLAFDFAFFKSDQKVSLILEIQGGLHSEKHFAETEENFHERIERDEIKREFCRKYQLKLVEIDYKSPGKKELRRIQSLFTQLLTDYHLIPCDINIPDFSEFAFYITLEYQKFNSNTLTIKKLVKYVLEGKRIGEMTDIELIKQLFLSDKQMRTAYNRVILPEITYLLKGTDHSIKEISKITKVPGSVIRRINTGEIYSYITHASREEPLKKLKRPRIDEDTIMQIIKYLKETNLTFREIGIRTGVSEAVPKAINDGRRYTQYSGASRDNPIRKPKRQGEEQVRAIVELLLHTRWTQQEIADYIGVTSAIVQKINTGYNHSNITGASGDDPIRKRSKI